ncbi:hypothetical protein TorRG33x02_174250, partial [Trema orientale]
IKDLHIAEREEDIAYYAGYVGSAYMLGRALTSVFWGVVADRYGRKPVIILGTISVVNYWMAITTRFLLGSLNGLLGPIKAYSSEIFREEHQALGMSTVSAAWGIGLVIGPALGGFFAQIFSLWALSPRKFGGLSYSTEVVGEVLVIAGINYTSIDKFLIYSLVIGVHTFRADKHCICD